MSTEAVRIFFKSINFPRDIIELEESSATVDLAAEALGVYPELIAKTLAFKTKDRNIVIVTCGTAKIDNKKFKTTFQCKAKMLSSEEVLEFTGHPVGGVCPFGLKTPMDIFLDESLKNFEFVYPAAGSPTTALKLTVNELENITKGTWVDVCL